VSVVRAPGRVALGFAGVPWATAGAGGGPGGLGPCRLRGLARGPAPKVIILRISWCYHKAAILSVPDKTPADTNQFTSAGWRSIPAPLGKDSVQQGVIICSSRYAALVMAQCRHWSSTWACGLEYFSDRLIFLVAVGQACKRTRRGVGHPLFS
jgi:hypothetical protein